MEQPSNCNWMGARRKSSERAVAATHISTLQAAAGGCSYDHLSWEEVAFAEDAAGHLGAAGCIWPPRSYSCSFCRREFRSAQALGGHMNVHRRDRAKLRQSCSSHISAAENLEDRDHQINLNPISIDHMGAESLQVQNNLLLNMTSSNPNPKLDVSAALTIQEMNLSSDHTKRCSISISSSSCFRDKMESLFSPPGSPKHSKVPLQLFMVPEAKLDKDHDHSVSQGTCRLKRCKDLCEDISDAVNCRKRRITDHKMPTVTHTISSSYDQEKFQSKDQVHDLNHFNLDLELRLGAPK